LNVALSKSLMTYLLFNNILGFMLIHTNILILLLHLFLIQDATLLWLDRISSDAHGQSPIILDENKDETQCNVLIVEM
jgi:hypothetical protein